MFLYRNRWRSSCSRIRRFEGAGRPILLLAMGVCLLSAVGCGTVTPLTTVPTNVVLPVGGVEVPVAIVTNQIYMDVMINGTGPHRFALDTGSALSLISPTVADQFPANQLNSFTTLLGPFGPTSRFQLFRVDSLGIGNMEFQNFSAAIQDVSASFPAAPFTVAGMLGVGVFRNVLLTLNYPGGTIKVESGALPAADNCTILPITGGDLTSTGVFELPQVPVTLQGQTVLAPVDSGNNTFLILPDSFANLPFLAAPIQVPTLTENGTGFFLQGVLNGTVALGCAQVNPPTLLVGGSLASLGAAALRPFVVTIDQASKGVRFAAP